MELRREVRGRMPLVAVRVAPFNYLVALLLASVVSAFLLYLELGVWSLILLAVAWIAIPFLAYTDRTKFDGRRIHRTGLLPRFWGWLTETRDRIKISDVE